MIRTSQPYPWQSHAWLFLILLGISMISFSAYMMVASIEQRTKIMHLTEQTRLLRNALNEDHLWHVKQHNIFIDLEHSALSLVRRKEAMIRAFLKRQYHWTDADIDAAIRDEMARPDTITPEPTTKD